MTSSAPSMHEIVLIEDSAAEALLLQRTLQRAGVTNPIRRLSNGREALSYLYSVGTKANERLVSAPAVLLLDLKLPDVSGFDILAFVRHRKIFSKTLRVVLSQYSDLQSIKRAYAGGAHSFLSKAAGQQEIEELVKSFPEYWLLAPAINRIGPEDEGKCRVSLEYHDLFEHREAVERLRAGLVRLREELGDNEETFALIDSILDDFRESVKAFQHHLAGAYPGSVDQKPELSRN